MSSVQEYCEKMSTEKLQQILREEAQGKYELPLDTILVICSILAERNPNKRDVHEAFQEFLTHYLDEE